ncbi:MAG TPA: hypothetical protein PKB09_04045 [Candidatus Saccharibacteria bacterium]|nr:hypothetical protein [Candidatus Saccharibacteria bacterium]
MSFSFDSAESQHMREQRLLEMMDHVLFPSNNPTDYFDDDRLLTRTVGQAVSELAAGFDETAVPYELAEARRLEGGIDLALKERHVATLIQYASGKTASGIGSLKNSGINTVAGQEFDESMPHTDAFGYSWYRRYQFELGRGALYLFAPWLQPWYQGGSPFPRAYAVDDVDMSKAQAVVLELSVA